MAQTPWGELAVADAHTHFFSHRFYSVLAAQKKLSDITQLGALTGMEIPQEDPVLLAQRWVSELDRHGITRAALIASVPEDEESVEAAVTAFPNRFFGFSMLDPLRAKAHERVTTTLKRKVIRCLCLFPALHGYSIADPRLVPLFETVADHRATVFVHCGSITVGIRKKLGLPTPVDLRFSNPVDLQPVAVHFPQIRFIIPHFGAGYFREALMVADMTPNIYLDTSSSNRWMNYDPAGIDLRTVFRRAIDVVGPSRLLFGTDSSFFPRGWQQAIFAEQTKALYEIGLDADQAKLILHDNLINILS